MQVYIIDEVFTWDRMMKQKAFQTRMGLLAVVFQNSQSSGGWCYRKASMG